MDAFPNLHKPHRPRIQVAVGVIFNLTGKILVAKRLPHQHQGTCWEFPGGKLELEETVALALKRELQEEVGIWVTQHQPWLEVSYDYEDKAVHLNVHQVTAFEGDPIGREGQEIRWLFPHEIAKLPLPEANKPIVQRLIEEH